MVFRDHIGILENQRETTIVYWDNIEIMGKKLEPAMWVRLHIPRRRVQLTKVGELITTGTPFGILGQPQTWQQKSQPCSPSGQILPSDFSDLRC